MAEDPLPYTTTHAQRGSRVGFLGIEGAQFGALWPLFAGAVLSVALSVAFVAGGFEEGWAWQMRSVAAGAPISLGYLYLRLLVEGKPPHFKADMCRTLRSCRISFGRRHLPVLHADSRRWSHVGSDPDARVAFGLARRD